METGDRADWARAQGELLNLPIEEWKLAKNTSTPSSQRPLLNLPIEEWKPATPGSLARWDGSLESSY